MVFEINQMSRIGSQPPQLDHVPGRWESVEYERTTRCWWSSPPCEPWNATRRH